MAKGFQFELQSVLEHRERLERLQQGEVARIEAERLAVEDRIRAIQEEMNLGRRELRDSLSGGAGGSSGGAVGITQVRLAAGASLHNLVRLQRAAIELAGVHQRLGKARRQLLKLAVDRKAVELLRARRHAEYVRRMARAEQNELDDLVVMRSPAQAWGAEA